MIKKYSDNKLIALNMIGGGAIVLNAIIIFLEKYWNRRHEQA